MVRKSYLEALDDEFDTAVKGGLSKGIFYACENKNLKDLRFRRLKINDSCAPYVLNAARKLKKLKTFMMIDCREVSQPVRKSIQNEMSSRGIACSIYDQYEEAN